MVRDGDIGNIGLGAADEVIDGAGATLMPGLIDAHMHTVRARPDLQNLSPWGVTAGSDMAA